MKSRLTRERVGRDAWVRPPVLLKGIRPAWVMLGQGASYNCFCDDGTIGEFESNFVVKLPFVGAVRMERHRHAAVPDFGSRGAALDL